MNTELLLTVYVIFDFHRALYVGWEMESVAKCKDLKPAQTCAALLLFSGQSL